MSRRVMVVGTEALGISLGEAATGADLGGSSKYSTTMYIKLTFSNTPDEVLVGVMSILKCMQFHCSYDEESYNEH